MTGGVIDKIAKLLALADKDSGGTEAERDLAMQRAQEMMLKYNLDHAAITNSKQSAPGDVEASDIVVKGAMNQWRLQLVAAVSEPAFVHVIYYTMAKHHKRIQLIGRADNIAYVRKLTEHLIPWLEAEEKVQNKDEKARREELGEFFNPRAFKRSFMESASYRIRARLHNSWRDVNIGTDLIRNEREANQQWIDKNVGRVRVRRSRGSGNAAGHSAGREAGNRADITPGRKLGE